VLWHFDELSEFAWSGHGGFNGTSDRGQIRPFGDVGSMSGLPESGHDLQPAHELTSATVSTPRPCRAS
jgi:hypothetical protein